MLTECTYMSEDLTSKLTREVATELLPVVEERRRATVDLLYQSPALSLAAQAFLFLIALDPGTSGLGRVIAALVGAAAAAATALGMLKHNYVEEMYASVVDRCQDILGGQRLHRHELVTLADGHGDNRLFERWKQTWWRRMVMRRSATDFWIGTLLFYLAVDLAVLALAIVQMLGGPSPLS
jgi:hypothetical protein